MCGWGVICPVKRSEEGVGGRGRRGREAAAGDIYHPAPLARD